MKCLRLFHKRQFSWLFYLIVLATGSCQQIETGDSLSRDQIEYIQQLGLLDKNEKIIRFYSEFKKKVAGNFFTDKRMASYWMDENDSTKNEKNFAFYKDIVSIDTNYMRGAETYAPYMMVTTAKGNSFKVCADGKHAAVKSFFETAIAKWKSEKNK